MPWWQLKSIADTDRQEKAQYYALPPDACPYDGQPLDVGTESEPGGGRMQKRHCIFCGYTWDGGRRLI